MDVRITALEGTVDALRDEVAELRDEIRILKRLVIGDQTRARDSDTASQRSSRVSDSSFSVVTRRTFNEDASRSRSDSLETTGARNVVEGTDPDRASSTRSTQSWLEREAICDEIAEHIKRCLRGDHRGESGRDRIHLPSKVWLVFRDYEGLNYRPVRVCRTWTACKELVKKAGDLGSSVFIGLPSEREACRVAAQAGVGWPVGR